MNKMTTKRLTVALSLCCGLSMTTLSQAAADYSTPKNAFRTYTKALADGDLQVLKNSVIATEKHNQLLENQITYAATEKKFRTACIKAYPAAAKDLADPTQDTLAALEKAEVKIEDDTATLVTRDSLEPVVLKRVDGKWKVNLVEMYDPASVDDVLTFRKALAAVMEDMTTDVDAHKYKSFDEVKNTLEMRVKMRMALPSEEEPTTKPAD